MVEENAEGVGADFWREQREGDDCEEVGDILLPPVAPPPLPLPITAAGEGEILSVDVEEEEEEDHCVGGETMMNPRTARAMASDC